MKIKKPFLGALKQYSNCYNIICYFKPHFLYVCLVAIFPSLISVHMKSQVILSTGRIFETILYFGVKSYSLSTDQPFP